MCHLSELKRIKEGDADSVKDKKVYLIRLFNDVYKIGVSNYPTQRASEVRTKSGYKATQLIQESKAMPVEMAMILEKFLHSGVEKYSYRANKWRGKGRWQGCTECFKLPKQVAINVSSVLVSGELSNLYREGVTL